MWHVLHVAPNSEQQICRLLAVHDVLTFAPRFAPPPRTKPGSVRDRRPRWVFPGYVFFEVPPDFARWDVIRWAPGARRILGQDGKPACLADAIVDRIRLRLADRSLKPAGHGFKRGQSVQILSGPLRMVDAVFDRELDGPARVQVLVQLLGRQMPIRVDLAILRTAG
jgi:transcription antitermination factor NusG